MCLYTKRKSIIEFGCTARKANQLASSNPLPRHCERRQPARLLDPL
jgi:hypothetical protein